MRIITLNVNGIRSASRKGFWDWFARQKADVLCLQEIRIGRDECPEIAPPKGYQHAVLPAVKPGYSGVAIYSRLPWKSIDDDSQWSPLNGEGRWLAADFGHVTVVSLYAPSGTSGPARQTEKYRFLDALRAHLDHLHRADRRLILCGDFNIAHREIDLKNWKSNRDHSGFLPEERAWFTHLVEKQGFVDAFRQIEPTAQQYTWWSNRGRARENNVGWRIDYQVVSQSLAPAIRKVAIDADQRLSDHAPLIIDYEFN